MSVQSTVTRSAASLPTMLAAAILLALGTVATTRAQDAPAASEGARHPVDIPAQSLPRALATLSSQTRLQVIYSDDAPYTVQAPALKGDYTDTEALDRLLHGSGLRWRQVSPGVVTLEKAPAGGKGDVVTGTLSVESAYGDHATGEARDRRGYDDVYDNDFSSVYKGRKEIERYRGNNPADLLKGMVNVYSGDARNSGALDPNIRGVEGPGRVPVLIDGTEQALTVWRGYNGANNRAYIDPSLIGGMQVLKGPTTARDVNGGIGGAVVVKTLDVDDVLAPGRTIGIDVRAEGANNSTSPRFPTLLTGQDYRTVPNFPGTPGAPVGTSPNAAYGDPSVRQVPRTDPQTLSMGDRAYRIAFAAKQDDFDYLAAYAYRKRGNYFSGKNDASYYTHENLYGMNNIVRQLGTAYEPGSEVPNTSSELQSWLGKVTWHIAPDQSLQFGARDTMSRYGEIMPSRILLGGIPNLGAVQWPESKVDAKAYNLEYRWKPDSPWLDLYANAWTTRTASHTYSGGGFPNYALGPSDPILRNTALADSQNNRIGLTLSNRMHFGDRVDFTVGGHWEHEKLSSGDVWNGADDGWRQFPRAGRRQEYDVHFDVQWRATDALTLEGGMRYSGYKAHDDFLASQIRAGKGDYFSSVVANGKLLNYRTIETTPDKYIGQIRSGLIESGLTGQDLEDILAIFRQSMEGQTYDFNNQVPWLPDANGKYHRADDICVNGFLSSVKNLAPGPEGCTVVEGSSLVQTYKAQAKTHRGHGWAPWFTASYQFTPNNRLYIRYAQAYRFPSMFESTIGFSASINPLDNLRPEHAYTWEAGYVHDLRDLFGLESDHRADVKLTWFSNTTRNVIERSEKLMFTNMDKKIVRGFELQGRYDNGRFFTDLGIAKTTTDKTCDESRAIGSDPVHGSVPNCVNYGFVSSYLITQATPKFSANLTLGARFFDRALEIGTRSVYYRAYSNSQLDRFVTRGTIGGYGLNVPYTWGTIVTYDAYADYKLHNGMTLELAGTNLGNRYYVDPLTRSLMPAPGRTIRLSVNARF